LKVIIALFFTLLFSFLLITPTVISLIDDTQDIAFFLDINEEEEENKGKGVAKDLKIKINATENFCNLLLIGIQKKKNVRFQSKNYLSEYPKKTTPPPELLS
jgi:hypothetical protein